MTEAVQSELLVSVLEYDDDVPCALVSLAGRAGIADCAWIRLLLEWRAEQGARRLVVDLSRLSAMDWWVALILIWAGRVVSRRGGLLMLAAPQAAGRKSRHAEIPSGRSRLRPPRETRPEVVPLRPAR